LRLSTGQSALEQVVRDDYWKRYFSREHCRRIGRRIDLSEAGNGKGKVEGADEYEPWEPGPSAGMVVVHNKSVRRWAIGAVAVLFGIAVVFSIVDRVAANSSPRIDLSFGPLPVFDRGCEQLGLCRDSLIVLVGAPESALIGIEYAADGGVNELCYIDPTEYGVKQGLYLIYIGDVWENQPFPSSGGVIRAKIYALTGIRL